MKKKTKVKKEKPLPQDGGLSLKEKERLRKAIAQVWQWESYARKLCLKRALIEGGFARCEECLTIVPKVHADHINPRGSYDEKYVERTFCSSKELKALCAKCHGKKTRAEIKLRKK